MSSAAANSRGTRAWPVRFAGGSVASVAARAAFVDGTIADAGAWSSPPTGRVEGRTTTRGGVVLGPWGIRPDDAPLQRHERLGQCADALEALLAVHGHRAVHDLAESRGNDGRRSASGVGLPT